MSVGLGLSTGPKSPQKHKNSSLPEIHNRNRRAQNESALGQYQNNGGKMKQYANNMN